MVASQVCDTSTQEVHSYLCLFRLLNDHFLFLPLSLAQPEVSITCIFRLSFDDDKGVCSQHLDGARRTLDASLVVLLISENYYDMMNDDYHIFMIFFVLIMFVYSLNGRVGLCV